MTLVDTRYAGLCLSTLKVLLISGNGMFHKSVPMPASATEPLVSDHTIWSRGARVLGKQTKFRTPANTIAAKIR